MGTQMTASAAVGRHAGYGGSRILTNAILTHGVPQISALLIALAWLAATTVVAGLLFRHNMRTARVSHSGMRRSRQMPSEHDYQHPTCR